MTSRTSWPEPTRCWKSSASGSCCSPLASSGCSGARRGSPARSSPARPSWPVWFTQHLIAPVHTAVALDPANVFQVKSVNNNMIISAMPTFTQQGAWVLSSQVVDESGHAAHITTNPVCFGGNFAACQAWIGRLHLRQVITYEPASRFLDCQWAETTIFVVLALALAGFCIWWIRRRVT